MSDKKYEDFGKRIAEKFTDFGKKKDKDIHISFSFGGNTKNIDIDTDDFEGISFFCGGSKGKTEADGNKQKQGENSEKTWDYKKDLDDGVEKIRREAEEIRREAEKIRREAEKTDLNREAEKIRREAEEIRRKVEREYNKRERAGSEEDPKGDSFSGKTFTVPVTEPEEIKAFLCSKRTINTATANIRRIMTPKCGTKGLRLTVIPAMRISIPFATSSTGRKNKDPFSAVKAVFIPKILKVSDFLLTISETKQVRNPVRSRRKFLKAKSSVRKWSIFPKR